MTQKQFDHRCARILRSFERYAKRVGMDEARLKWREDEQLIYVKRHVVEAYFRKRKPRRRSTTAIVAASLGRELH
jgi:hypothetical protein